MSQKKESFLSKQITYGNKKKQQRKFHLENDLFCAFKWKLLTKKRFKKVLRFIWNRMNQYLKKINYYKVAKLDSDQEEIQLMFWKPL